jgi:hypothetical protein
MGTDRIGVEMPDTNVEAASGRFGKPLGAVELIGIEVDVRVEIADRALGHRGRLAETPQKRESLGFLWKTRRL